MRTNQSAIEVQFDMSSVCGHHRLGFNGMADGTTLADIGRIANSRRRQTSQVPFIEKTEMEALAEELLVEVGYTSGEVSLEAIIERERGRCGLLVITNLPPPNGENRLERVMHFG